MDRKLFGKVIQRKEGVCIVETLLILSVAAFHFAIVSWRVRTDQFVSDPQGLRGGFKESREILFAVREAVGELKSIIRLNTLHLDASASIPLYQATQEVGGGVSRLLWISPEETKAGILVNGSILEQSQLRVCNTPPGHYLHIHLDPLTWVIHLLVGFWRIPLFLFLFRKHTHPPHHPEQALRSAGIAPLAEPTPQLYHTKIRISSPHISDELQFLICMLVRMTVWPPGSASQGFHTSVPSGPPEVDIGPSTVIFSAGLADTVFFSVLHQGLPICHVLCYTLAHEGCGPLSLVGVW